jgi:hypothetical protein
MHKANVEYRGIDEFLLVLQRVHGYSSDAIPLSRDKIEKLLGCTEEALKQTFDGSLSKGDFCRFIGLGLNSHFLLSMNLNDTIYKGYDLSIHQLKLLKASLKNALNKADNDVEESSG